MQKDQFLQFLHDELVRNGMSGNSAQRQVRAISQSLSPEDIADIEKITEAHEIAALARGIVMFRQKNNPPAASAPKPDIPADSDIDPDADMKIYKKGELSTTASATKLDAEDYNVIRDDQDEIFRGTARGKKTFWTIFLCTLPLTLILLLAYYVIFAAAFIALCALIVVLVGILIVGVAAGVAIAIAGIIFGIIQLLTVASSAPGLYEIGLGVMILGGVMFGGILVYNTALRLIPYLIRQLGYLFRICSEKLKGLLRHAKEACYKL